MTIAVNTRSMLGGQLEGFGYFIHEVFWSLALRHPQHKFYFLFDRAPDPSFVFPENVIPLVVTPQARHPLLWRIWYDLKVPLVLKKIRADVFVSPDGFSSLTTRVPQCLVVHDLGFLHHPAAYKSSHLPFLKRNMPRYLKKADVITTVSQFSKQDIVAHYLVESNKIEVVYSAAKEIFKPSDALEQTSVRDKYTEGQSYFIYVGALQPRKNLVHLLKAFSIFKKRQQSGMKLVLAGRLAWKNEKFLSLLETYKYKNDVILTGYLDEEELVRLVASSYALVYPSLFEGFGVPVLEGMKCNVPVLTSEKSSMQEIAGDAGLYFNPKSYEDMADKMMRIYKDEELRKELIEKGKMIAAKYSWETTADLMWSAILKAAARDRQNSKKSVI